MSKKNKKQPIHKIRLLRRISQAVFFFLFLFLLFQTEFRGTFDEDGAGSVQIGYPVSIFLEMDPLVAFSTAISTHTLYGKLIWAVLIIIGTLIFGRFFCGWICPLGTLSHFLSSYKPERRGRTRVTANKYKGWMSVKYYLLFGLIITSIFSSVQTGLIDPIPFLVRSLSVSVLPAMSYALGNGLDYLYNTDVGFLKTASDAGYYVFGSNILSYVPRFFHFGWVIGVIFVVVMLLNRFITRFWCRGICPLGAFFGLISRFAIFGMVKDDSKCDDCNLCKLHCQGACDPQGGAQWRQAECHLCFNCEAVCPNDVIKFRFFPGLEGIKLNPDLKRRRVLASVAAGAAALPVMRASTGYEKRPNEFLIRPPGSVAEDEFLARCIRCGECMKVCPTNSIQPTMLEAGPEGIWTPMLVMRVGPCEHTCVLCSEVCPTGAIWKITEAEKLGKTDPDDPDKEVNPMKIGTAFFDRGRCLPWAMATACIVCEEFCPTSPKAIWTKEEEVTRPDGTTVVVKRPHVDPERCIGCGTCESVCPVQNKPAVYVTNIGETRSRTNQILLESGKSEK